MDGEAFAGPYGGSLAAAQDQRSKTMALAFGLRNAITYEMKTQAQVDNGRSLNRQAVADGKPTVLVEIGQNGERDGVAIDTLTRDSRSLLRMLKDDRRRRDAAAPRHPAASATSAE